MALVLAFLSIIITLLAGVFQLYIGTNLKLWGRGRVVEQFGHHPSCHKVTEAPGCEKIVLHQASGTLYMSCGTLEQRASWLSASNTSIPEGSYIATYDIHNKVTRLSLDGLDTSRTVAFHGMDVVPSHHDHGELFLYLVHHKSTLDGSPGFDSSVEIFKTYVGSNSLTHIKTVESPHIFTPNDIVGHSDGKSFFFTNTGSKKTGNMRVLHELFFPSSSIGYCHVDTGCKIAMSNLQAANGLAAAPNGTLYVASSQNSGIRVLDRQEDNSLVLDDLILTETIIDNLSIDQNGMLWAAGLPKLWDAIRSLRNISHKCPSAAYQFSINTGVSSFYGQKYRMQKMFEDDGEIMSLISTVVHDAERKKVYYHGLVSPWLLVCPSS